MQLHPYLLPSSSPAPGNVLPLEVTVDLSSTTTVSDLASLIETSLIPVTNVSPFITPTNSRPNSSSSLSGDVKAFPRFGALFGHDGDERVRLRWNERLGACLSDGDKIGMYIANEETEKVSLLSPAIAKHLARNHLLPELLLLLEHAQNVPADELEKVYFDEYAPVKVNFRRPRMDLGSFSYSTGINSLVHSIREGPVGWAISQLSPSELDSTTTTSSPPSFSEPVLVGDILSREDYLDATIRTAIIRTKLQAYYDPSLTEELIELYVRGRTRTGTERETRVRLLSILGLPLDKEEADSLLEYEERMEDIRIAVEIASSESESARSSAEELDRPGVTHGHHQIRATKIYLPRRQLPKLQALLGETLAESNPMAKRLTPRERSRLRRSQSKLRAVFGETLSEDLIHRALVEPAMRSRGRSGSPSHRVPLDLDSEDSEEGITDDEEDEDELAEERAERLGRMRRAKKMNDFFGVGDGGAGARVRSSSMPPVMGYPGRVTLSPHPGVSGGGPVAREAGSGRLIGAHYKAESREALVPRSSTSTQGSSINNSNSSANEAPRLSGMNFTDAGHLLDSSRDGPSMGDEERRAKKLERIFGKAPYGASGSSGTPPRVVRARDSLGLEVEGESGSTRNSVHESIEEVEEHEEESVQERSTGMKGLGSVIPTNV
ncbi:hypothetical protein YB2330_006481 [Saitoella coloradoensis]